MARKEFVVTKNNVVPNDGGSMHTTQVCDADADRRLTGLVVGDLILVLSPPDAYIATGATTVESLVRAKRTPIANINYTALKSDYIIAYTGMTATRTVTLPSASSCGAGKMFILKDEGGSVGGAINIVIDPAGSETVDGFSTYNLTVNSGSVWIYTDGSNWFTI